MINNERIIYSNVEETMINRRSENGMRHSSVRVALVLGWILVGCGPTAAIQAAAPNMVVVLADDLGYGDLGCYGHKQIKTPNIDQFAAQGLRLTHCYSASANCSPARAGLMTGRTPYRMGIHSWIPFGSPMHVGRNEIMVPKLLRQAK